jgi:hypothetical protein
MEKRSFLPSQAQGSNLLCERDLFKRRPNYHFEVQTALKEPKMIFESKN